MNAKLPIVILASSFFVILAADAATAQTGRKRFEIGFHVVSLEQRVLDKVDCGLGGRFTFYPITHLAVEAEADIFPRDLGAPVAFSRRRVEAFFGFKAGPRFGPFGVFGKLRPGLIRFSRAPRGIACLAILVYPPPLECSISAGSANFALDMGGGVEIAARRAPVGVRLDVGDTMIRFSGPAYTVRGRFNGDFNTHNFQLNIGVAYRF